MGLTIPSRPSISVAGIAATVNHGITQACTRVAAALQGIRQPALPMVPMVKTSRGESWYMPAPMQAHDALLMLLLTPHERMHSRLQSALQTLVVAHLQHLPHLARQPPGVIEAMTAALRTGCLLEKAYGSVLTPAQRDAVWRDGPYRDGDPASDLLLNYLALIQGKMIEMAFNTGQYGVTDYPELPEKFDQQQAALVARLNHVQTQSLANEALVKYRQLNQWLPRQEWLVQLPVGMVLQVIHWLLPHSLPSTAVARQLGNHCQGKVSAQALGEQWQTIWSQLQQPSSLREYLEGLNKALEQGMLNPVAVFYGLSNLSSMAVPLIPLILMAAALLVWGQEKFAGWLHDFVGSPSSEATRTLQELGRLGGNCASLNQYLQSTPSSPDERLNPSVPLGITQVVDNSGERAHPLEHGGAQPLGHELTPGVTEPPATSAGGRPTGIMQAVQRAVSASVGLLWKTRSPDVPEQADVETPLYPAPSAVYRPTTAPIAAAGQHWPTPAAGLGIGAASVALVTGANALYQFMTADPGLIQPPSEPVIARATPQDQDLEQALKNHWHITPEGELMSTWEALMAMRTDPALAAGARAQQARVIALLHQDFGVSLARLQDLAMPAADADFDEFDALEESAPGRHRRAAETGPPAAELALANDVIALLDQASSGTQQQEQWLQQAILRQQLSRLPPGHWLRNARANEQALWLTTRQTLEEGYQRLADLKYASLTQFDAQRPALQQALARVKLIELQLSALESQLKGDLSPGGPYMDGLAVVNAAFNNDPHVDVGRLQLSTGQGAHAVSLTLAQWTVFVRHDARGTEDGVVLYRPAERRVQAFNTQQEMYQYLDLKRMRQALQAEVQPPATPGPAAGRPAVSRSMPELALEVALPAQRAAWQQNFDELGRRPDRWTPEQLQLHTFPGATLQAKLEHQAGARLDQEQARLQRLAANPELAAQTAALAHTEQQYATFLREHLHTLRDYTARSESQALTEALQGKGGLASNATVDADALLITFNGQTLSWTDWVLEGYRQHGDNVIAASNNFLADARFEHEDAAVVRALGTPGVKQGAQQHLRSTYAGDRLIKYLQQLRAPNNPLGQRFGELRTDLIQQQMQLALQQALVDGTIDPYTAEAFKTLVGGVRTETDTGTASLQTFQAGGRPIPGVYVLSRRQRATPGRHAEALRSDYVFLEGPNGTELRKLADYQQLIRTSGVYYDDLQARTLLKDKQVVEAIQRGQSDTRASTAPIADFTRHVGDQWLADSIDNIREASTSRGEMIIEQVVKGLRAAAGVTCTAGTAGIAAVPCAALTLGLIGHDVGSALHHLVRGRPDDALMDVAFLALDALDVGPGLRALRLGTLAHWAGKSHFSSALEVDEALQGMFRQLSLPPTANEIDKTWAWTEIKPDLLSEPVQRPGKATAGIFYQVAGEYYIKEGQIFQVYTDNAWSEVRIRKPGNDKAQGQKVHYLNDRWQIDKGGLKGGGPGPSSLRSNEEWNEYLHLFKFDAATDIDRCRELQRAFRSGHQPPNWIFRYLKDPREGWRAYGLLGWKPIDSVKPNYDPNSLKQLQACFDFSTAPPGNTLNEWLLHDRFKRNFYTPGKYPDEGGEWPSWAIKYAKKDTILDFYKPIQVLSSDKETFPSKDVARAYLREIEVLDQTSRTDLIANWFPGHGTPDLIKQFPEQARVGAKIQALAKTSDFANENAVIAYLDKFAFTNTDDGQILKMALLSDRIKGGRTPAWAGEFLQHEGWKKYKTTPVYTELGHQNLLDMVLIKEGIFSSPTEITTYTSSFITKDQDGWIMQDLREELVLDKLLERDRPPVWAFTHAKPSTRMIIYKSQDIPADLEHFDVELGLPGCERNLVLPANMPNLKTVRIKAARDPNAFKATLASQMAEIETLHVKGVQLQHESLQLENLPKMQDLSILGCSGTQNIQLGEMPNLKTLRLSDNAQLSQLKMPDEWPMLDELRISGNPDLQLEGLNYPQKLPELLSLYLENNNLAEVSFMEHMNMPKLTHLELSGNRLQDLEHLPRLPRLSSLGLRNNQFVTLPDYIRTLPNEVSVNMVGNTRLNQRIQQEYEASMATAGHIGPQVQFAIQGNDLSVRNARPLAEAVSDWFAAEQQEGVKRQWGAYAGEAHASVFSAFLDKLRRSPSSDSEVFKNAAPNWLDQLTTDDELRLQTFLKADEATASCDDRVSLVYNQMQEIALRFAVTRGDFDNVPTQLRAELRTQYRLQQLDNFAQYFIRKNPRADEVEVFLALREKLRSDLNLPGLTSNMLYLASSRLKEKDFLAAKAYVLHNEEKIEGGFKSYLINSEAMRAVVKRQFQQEYEQASENLNQLVQDTETGRYAEVRARMLSEQGLSVDDADAIRTIGPVVMESFYEEYYGPLIDRFFKPAR